MDLDVAGVIVVVVYWIIRREFIYLLTDLFVYLFTYCLVSGAILVQDVLHWMLDDFGRKWLWPSLR